MGIAQATGVKALGTISSSVASKWKPLQGLKTVVKGHSCWMQRYKSPERQTWLMMKLFTRTSHLQSDGHALQGFTLSSSSILWGHFCSLKVIVYLEAILESLKWHTEPCAHVGGSSSNQVFDTNQSRPLLSFCNMNKRWQKGQRVEVKVHLKFKSVTLFTKVKVHLHCS